MWRSPRSDGRLATSERLALAGGGCLRAGARFLAAGFRVFLEVRVAAMSERVPSTPPPGNLHAIVGFLG